MTSSYTPLAESDIRLITVVWHDGFTASLQLETYARTVAPEYDVVSYAWGKDESNTLVKCNDVPLEIRTNLFKALPYIHETRPEPRTRPLWIDAICLNQNDNAEKATHVPRMGEVYENAKRTLIWLGEADSLSNLALDNLENLTQKLLTIQGRGTLPFDQMLSSHDLPSTDDQIWEAVRVLQLRAWFFRLWTFQEIILSKDAFLLCGSKSVPWNALVALQDAGVSANLSFMVQAKADPSTPYKRSGYAIRHVAFVKKLRGTNHNVALPILLTLSVDRGYSDPVDRVWALLGLLNKRYRQLIQDAKLVKYGETANLKYHETFMNVLKFHIKHDTNLAIQLIEDNQRSVRNPSLASWCPDWHTDRGGVPLARMPEAAAGIPGGKHRRIEPFMKASEDSSLEICGLEVDTIECVTSSAGQNLLDLKSLSWIVECWNIVKDTPFVAYSVYPDDAALPATPTTLPDGSPIPEERQRYMRAEAVVKYLLFPPGVLVDNSTATLLRCNGRKFFRTKQSRLGIGPANLEKGDILCAMYGARTMWALRPYKSSEEETQEPQTAGEYSQSTKLETVYELVGSVYTPSLLKGQAWVGRSCEEMQRFKLR